MGLRNGWRVALIRQPGNRALLKLLKERGSLTARLVASCQEFRVQRLRQSLEPVRLEEARGLCLRPGTMAWVREVRLICDGQTTVFAHTVMPRQPLHPFDRHFQGLGNRSLGSLLFADPGIRRGELEFKQLDIRHPLYRRAAAAANRPVGPVLWARRSLFRKGSKGLLVTEVFFPE